MAKVPYTKPLVTVTRPRLTLEEFLKSFEMYLERNPEYKDAIITDAAMIDHPGRENDGSVIFNCYLPEEDSCGRFVVPVVVADNLQ